LRRSGRTVRAPAMLFVGIGLLVGPKVLDEVDLARSDR
jgi:hypothetical protein